MRKQTSQLSGRRQCLLAAHKYENPCSGHKRKQASLYHSC